MSLCEKMGIILGIWIVLIVVGLVIVGWAFSGGAKNAPITHENDNHQDPDNYA